MFSYGLYAVEKQDHHRGKQVDLKVYVYHACAAAEGSHGVRKESRRGKQAAKPGRWLHHLESGAGRGQWPGLEGVAWVLKVSGVPSAPAGSDRATADPQ